MIAIYSVAIVERTLEPACFKRLRESAWFIAAYKTTQSQDRRAISTVETDKMLCDTEIEVISNQRSHSRSSSLTEAVDSQDAIQNI